jgi:tetratricopeptide (TPR) repeat protein
MQCGRWLTPIVASLLITSAQAQIRGGNPAAVGNVHIRVILGNDRNAGPYLQVRLLDGGSGTMIGNTYTNDIGEAQFIGVPVGSYHVEVSGDGIQTTQSETFDVDNRKMTQSEWVTVRRLEESGPKPVSAHSTMISATDMNVPGKARKELEKANEAMAMQNWKSSQEHLNKAIALAPQWAIAYNNLAVLYAKMNDIPREEEALKKAIGLDEHFAPSLLNYGKLCLRQKNFPQAEEFLQKASTVDPDNPEILMLLAEAAYLDHHFDLAISSSHQAHTAGKDHPSFVHYIAARSYQQENRQAEALAEFNMFLQEEPKGPRADHVRGDIARIQNPTQVSAQ